jgi:hypothetical protein
VNKIMTVIGSFALGATLVFLFVELRTWPPQLVVFAGVSYLAGIVTALLPAIDHIFPKEDRLL